MIAPVTNPSMIVDYQQAGALMEQALLSNDLAKMSPAQRVQFYGEVCKSLKLNPLTRPFQYITLNGKLTLYASKDCTEQLRKINGVSLTIVSKELMEGLYIVTARATDATGRQDEATGAVDMSTLKGEARANAIMKAETKAKRRVTLSICGLGWTDESEISSIPNAKTVQVSHETGEIIEVQEAVIPEPQPAAQPQKVHDPLKTAKFAVKAAAQEAGFTGKEVWGFFADGKDEAGQVMRWAEFCANEGGAEQAAAAVVRLYLNDQDDPFTESPTQMGLDGLTAGAN